MAGIIEEDQTSLIKAFKEKGLEGLKQMILKNKDKWESIPVRIAVTGNSGVGKSSFINAFRGIKPKGLGAAAVGITETTTEVTAYPHPKNEQFVLYDLPGVGTQLFPRESYLKKVEFDKYDFFIILSCTRFTENDAWLGQQVKKRNKNFFFVRTKIDVDMENERDDTGDDYFNQDESLQKIRADAERNLKGLDTNVYLVTTKLRKIKLFDFDVLMKDVIQATPTLKKESLVLFLPSLTENVILEKEKVLSARAWKFALASGIGGAIPIPGLSTAIDGTIIVREAMFYREQFNLDQKSLENFEAEYKIRMDSLGLATRTIVFTAVGLLQVGVVGVAEEVGETALKTILPGIGSAIAGVMSFGTTLALLQNLLKKMKEDALKINSEVAKRMVETEV